MANEATNKPSLYMIVGGQSAPQQTQEFKVDAKPSYKVIKQTDASTGKQYYVRSWEQQLPSNIFTPNMDKDYNEYKTYGQIGSGEKIMDNGYEKIIDRLDRDMRDHKLEIRDRDAHLQSEMQERESRYHNEAKDREERILAAINASNTQFQTQLGDLKQSFKDSLTEVKTSVDRAEGHIDETSKHIQSMVTQNIWGRIGFIVAVLAICATIAGTIWAAYHSPSYSPAAPASATTTK